MWVLAACSEEPAQASEPIGAATADSEVILYWNEADGAQLYNIYWNNTGKDSAADAHTSMDSSPAAITGLRADSTYYFRVTSVSSAGESTPSPQIALRPTSAKLRSLVVSPDQQHMVAGTRQHFTATGVYSDGSKQDLSRLAKWNSSDTFIATVLREGRGAGLVSAVGFGSAVITASFRGVKGSATVSPIYDELRDLTVLPHNPQIAINTKIPFKVIGHFDNIVQDLTASVAWASSNPEIAGVSNWLGREGLVSALNIGESTISASYGGVVAQSRLSVAGVSLQSINLMPAEPTVALGLEQAFTAIGVYSDGTSKDITPNVIWGSSDPGVAMVTNFSSARNNNTPAGVAQTIEGGQGATIITARLQNISAETTLTVSEPLAISMKLFPESMALAVGESAQFTNADIFYTDGTSVRYDISPLFSFAVSDSSLAIIDDIGSVTGVAPGDTTVVATFSASPLLSAIVPVNVYATDVMPTDHGLIRSGCVDCHDGKITLGKSAAHPMTSDVCEACHGNQVWKPVLLPFAHEQAVDSCIACHNNQIAKGKSSIHPNTSDVCENCHITTDWLQIVFDHNAVAGQACASSGCHDGQSNATYKSANHPATSDVCEACHNNVSWLPVLIPFDHTQVITPICSDCHSTSLPVGHCATKEDCAVCHNVYGWLPAMATCTMF